MRERACSRNSIQVPFRVMLSDQIDTTDGDPIFDVKIAGDWASLLHTRGGSQPRNCT